MEHATQKFNTLKIINYLELILQLVAYVVSLHWVGIVPGLIICILVHFLIGLMEKKGMTRTAKALFLVILGVKVLQVWIHKNSFEKGLTWTEATLPFQWDYSFGGWYLAFMFLVIDLVALWALGNLKTDEKAETEAEAESVRATEFVRLEAEREKNRAEEARRTAEIEMAKINAQRLENQSITDRIRAEKLAEAEAAIKIAEAEAERRRKERAEMAALQFPPKTATKQPVGTERNSAAPSESSDKNAAFKAEFDRAKSELIANGSSDPTQKEIGARMVWRGQEGVSDKTIRNYLNQ